MTTWRLARSLDTLRAQINKLAPARSKISDGTIGDTAHSARTSDHNPDANGVVHAIDITHDPAGGIDGQALGEALSASRDPRIKYIISNRRICAGKDGPSPWQWRPYDGTNPHTHHVHISVRDVSADDASAWDFRLDTRPRPPAIPSRPLLSKGSKGRVVEELQLALNRLGARLRVDGDFGPATRTAVMAFQREHGLYPDGVVGPYTWEAL